MIMKNSIFPNQYNKITFHFKENKNFVSVIIPVYKDVQGLSKTLQSLKNQTLLSNQFEVIVANDSGDEKISSLCDIFKIKEIKIIPRKGSYNARNYALVFSKGEYLAFTDANVIVPKNWLKYGVECLKQFDYVGGPVNIDKTQIHSLTNIYSNYAEFHIEDLYKTLNFFPTANLFIKRTIIESIGGFDNRLLSSGDAEFGNRIQNYSSYVSYLSKKISVLHPPRNYYQYIEKLKRIAQGEKDLYYIYPTRFQRLKKSIWYESLYIRYIPNFNNPNLSIFNIYRLTILAVWFNIIRMIFNIISKPHHFKK